MNNRSRKKPLSDKALCARGLTETIAIIITCVPLIYWYVIHFGTYEPHHRGFFCDDENLKHPYLPEQISVELCVAIWIILVLFFVFLIEIVYCCADQERQVVMLRRFLTKKKNLITEIPRVVFETYRILGFFAIGAVFCLLTTEIAKYNVGRLRPYFLSVCKIKLTPELCKDGDYEKFVTNYTCGSNGDEDVKMVREARKSFLSGHSSFSFYCAVFIIMYLHSRLSSDALSSFDQDQELYNSCSGHGDDDNATNVIASSNTRQSKKTWPWIVLRGLKILRPFLQFGCFCGALFISLSRITDLRHHPGDVVTGIIVGLFFAAIILMFLADIFKGPREPRYQKVVSRDIDAESPKNAMRISQE